MTLQDEVVGDLLAATSSTGSSGKDLAVRRGNRHSPEVLVGGGEGAQRVPSKRRRRTPSSLLSAGK